MLVIFGMELTCFRSEMFFIASHSEKCSLIKQVIHVSFREVMSNALTLNYFEVP